MTSSGLHPRISYLLAEIAKAEIPNDGFDLRNPAFVQQQPKHHFEDLEEIEKQLKRAMKEEKNVFEAKQEDNRRILIVIQQAKNKLAKKFTE